MRKVRRLRPGEEPPPGRPARYRTTDGYIVLRWRVGREEFIECLEHRLQLGIPEGHVHHVNTVKTDNDIKNLAALTPTEHFREHRRIDYEQAATWYREGKSQYEIAALLGCHAATISRVLTAQGVEIRSVDRNPLKLPVDEILRLFDEGMRPRAIGKRFGTSDTPIRKILSAEGRTPHPAGRPTIDGQDPVQRGTAEHGTISRYRSGCPCDECKAANATSERNRRAKSTC